MLNNVSNWAAIVVAAMISATPAVKAGNLPAAVGFAACSANFYKGFVPRVPAEHSPGLLREVCFDNFAVLHSGQSKTPVYVAEYLTPDRVADAKGEERSDKFYEEARLPQAERARLADYVASNYDRGHMAPAADMPNPNAMAQSFSLANMVPQAPKNNRGVWAKSVEKATRSYVSRGNSVYVITGPIYRSPVTTIGANKVWVPTALFKLVYDPAKKSAWAYVVANQNEAKASAPISYQELVGLTGVYYLPTGSVN